MNYQEVVNKIKEILDNHFMINEVGEGAISDINYPKDGQSPDYPYAFINSQNLTLGFNTFEYQFNLIVMTQCLEENILAQQSNMIQIINDVYTTILGTFDDPLLNISDNINVTPFKERFADLVVGGTALITITYGRPLNKCELPSTGLNINTKQKAYVIDTNAEVYELNLGETFSCTAEQRPAGIFYQRVIPWDGNDPNIDGSVYSHLQNGTYDYSPPSSPVYIACKANNYFGDDTNCVLIQPNAFGNYYRFTNDIGQQFVEDFHKDANNNSTNPKYCIDHLTGLGFYVQKGGFFPQGEAVNRSFAEGMEYANTFSYAGFSDWRLIDIGEYLNAVSYNDWVNSYGDVYAPFVDTQVRQYGAMLMTGSYTKDNQFIRIQTNGTTVRTENSVDTISQHLIMVRNHYITT